MLYEATCSLILLCIFNRGVVQLFNAVKEQQRVIESKLKDAGSSERRRDKVMTGLSKGSFLDMLKDPSNKTNAVKPEDVQTYKKVLHIVAHLISFLI